MRIVGTTATPGEGLVQVYHNNMWKLVCDEQWDTTDADVACRQLGYQSSSTALSFPISNQRKEHWTAWLNNVQCVGDESSLLSCKHGSLLQKSTCTTKQMAGMKCSGIQGKILIVNVRDYWGKLLKNYGAAWVGEYNRVIKYYKELCFALTKG